MKIAQINAVYGYGSTGLIVRDLDETIRREGHETFAVYQRCSLPPENGWRMGNVLDWKLHGILTRVFGKQSYFSHIPTGQLLKKLKAEKPDVVHLHNVHSNYIHLPMLLRFLARENIPTVLTLHDCWFFTGKCFHFVACGCEKWKTRCEQCPQKKSDVKSMFFDASGAVFDDRIATVQAIENLTVVGCSQWITELAQQSPIFKGKRFAQIYNGVDTTVFRPKDRHLRDEYAMTGKFVVLAMANKWFNPQNAAPTQMLIDNLQEDEQVLLVGCTSEQQAHYAQDERVVAVGYIRDRDKLADLYNMADVFVNLTLEDTLPTVNMEAICCGTPVITYRSCGSPELVHEGETGYVVSPLDGKALLAAIRRVKGGNLSRLACAECGKELFEKTAQYTQYVRLYETLI